MPGLDYAELRRRIPMRRVLALLNYQPTVCRGDQWRGRCPLCGPGLSGDRDRCFSVHVGRHLFHCHRCAASGNVLDLWCHVTALPLHAAALDLCERLQEPPPWHRR